MTLFVVVLEARLQSALFNKSTARPLHATLYQKFFRVKTFQHTVIFIWNAKPFFIF